MSTNEVKQSGCNCNYGGVCCDIVLGMVLGGSMVDRIMGCASKSLPLNSLQTTLAVRPKRHLRTTPLAAWEAEQSPLSS